MRQKYLAHAILHNEQVWRTAVIGLNTDGNVSIEKFDVETPGTIFVSGIVCVCAAERLTEPHRKTLECIVQSTGFIETAIRLVKEYMSVNGLYMNNGVVGSTPLLLPLKR